MDPYLEDPALWPDVHHALIEMIRETLVPRVRPKYLVRVEQRVYLNAADDPAYRVLVPDLRIVETARRRRKTRAPVLAGSGGITEPVAVVELLDQEVAESRVEIIDRADKSVVAMIEVVSPTNKIAGSEARRSFIQKRREVTASPAHWIEIDLLRAGVRTAHPVGVAESDYLVYLDQQTSDSRRRFAWPFNLEDHLPTIAIPLRAPDADVPLDLQVVLETVYDRAGYDLEIDYKRNPVVPLEPQQAKWAKRVVRTVP
jgi:hypothetical protein